MIKIFIVLIAAAFILPLAYFQFKELALPKRMLIAGSIIAAACVAVFLQFLNFAFYVPFLAIFGISMIGAIVYAKIDEMEKEEKRQVAEEKRQKQQTGIKIQPGSTDDTMSSGPVKSLYMESAPTQKSFGMQTINVSREER